jgi:hypothetical protein
MARIGKVKGSKPEHFAVVLENMERGSLERPTHRITAP